jgi:hypothetical protein
MAAQQQCDITIPFCCLGAGKEVQHAQVVLFYVRGEARPGAGCFNR